MKIVIETIPHDQQRYPTVGDWYFVDSQEATATPIDRQPSIEEIATGKVTMVIRVSELSDWRRVFLIAVHELIEVGVCIQEGITTKQVDEFDMAFEKKREEIIEAGQAPTATLEQIEAGVLANIDEPGDAADCPIASQHCFATGIERLLASRLGVPWHAYELELEALP